MATMYSVRRLPSLAEKPSPMAWAQEINKHGVVCGGAEDAAGNYHAIVWPRNGGLVDLGVGFAAALNDTGEVVGNDAQGACRWSASGVATHLLPLPGYSVSAAYDINNLGQVVGDSQKGPMWTSDHVACMWDANGNVSELVPPMPIGTEWAKVQLLGVLINNHGHILLSGYSYPLNSAASGDVSFAWIHRNGAWELLTSSFVHVNDFSDSDSFAANGGIRWAQDTGFQSVPFSPPYAGATLNGINGSGSIVGKGGNSGFIAWPDGLPIALNALVPSGSPELTGGIDINDGGLVIASGYIPGTLSSTSYLLEPLTAQVNLADLGAWIAILSGIKNDQKGVVVRPGQGPVPGPAEMFSRRRMSRASQLAELRHTLAWLTPDGHGRDELDRLLDRYLSHTRRVDPRG